MRQVDVDLLGRRFGKLIAVSREKTKSGRSGWRCQCDCGGMLTIRPGPLMVGRASSCGCARLETIRRKKTRHGHSANKTSVYRAWKLMTERCRNKNNPIYGGRGVTVAQEWLGKGGFEAFLQCIGPKPGPEYSVDRIDSAGNYEPGNVRWATQREQQNNRRNNRRVEFMGRTQTVAQWAREVGINESVLRDRLFSLGWNTERALSQPVRKVRRP